jgi:hypothetical protein
LMWVILPYALVSLVLQCLLLVVGLRTVRQMYKARHLGARPPLSVTANGPLLGLFVLNLAQIVINAGSASGSSASTTPHLTDVPSPLAPCHPWPAGAARRSTCY